MRTVIGLNLGYNSSAVLVDPLFGIRLAISEERLTGEKNTKAFPVHALIECVKRELKQTDGEINIALSHYERITWRYFRYLPNFTELHNGRLFNDDMLKKLNVAAKNKDIWTYLELYIRIVCDIPDDVKINIRRFDHHTCHRLPAYYMSGYDDMPHPTISVTSDGFGDGLSLTVYNNATGEMLTSETLETSLGLMYQYVTGALGYKEHQHEGKITGLAAHGKPYYTSWFEDIIGFDDETGKLIPYYLLNEEARVAVENYDNSVELNANIKGFKQMLHLKETVYETVAMLSGPEHEADDADIAASIQDYAEKMAVQIIRHAIADEGRHMWSDDNELPNNFYITLSGGLFANVKVNYSVAKNLRPQGLYVLPPMGDEGTAIGAALAFIIDKFGKDFIDTRVFKKDELYLGHVKPYEDDLGDILHHIKLTGYKVSCIKEMEGLGIDFSYYLARLLSENKIVCVSRGDSEFGPRALGNHSILYDATEKSVNDSLNAKLGRTEFMPFAPITIDKFTNDLFEDTFGIEKSLKYMTITVPVKDEFADTYKAACHIDNTARPQIVSIEQNNLLYNVIQHYNNLTGKKVLINTSYNLHNQPIIYWERTAIESFLEADLDVLVLNNYIIEKQ